LVVQIESFLLYKFEHDIHILQRNHHWAYVMTISRQALFGKLGGTLFISIESAADFCKLRGNPHVDLAHWLHQLLQLPDSDLHRILRHRGVDGALLDRDIARALAALPCGATSVSDFSPHLQLAIERAWVLATLTFGDRRIRSAWLIAALIKTPELRRVLLDISSSLQAIPVEGLEHQLPLWITCSPEADEPLCDNTAFSRDRCAAACARCAM
jgi:type VI secretion system protein VasG